MRSAEFQWRVVPRGQARGTKPIMTFRIPHSAFRILLALWRLNLAEELQYRANFVASVLGTLFWIVTALLTLAVFFRHTSRLGGWDYWEVVALLGVFNALTGVIEAVLRPGIGELVDEVRSGKLDLILTRPVDAQLYVSFRRLDLWRFVDVALGLALAWYAVVRLGRVPSPLDLLGFVVTLASAVALVYAIWVALMSLAFWFVAVENLSVLFDAVYEAARYPVSAYPGAAAASGPGPLPGRPPARAPRPPAAPAPPRDRPPPASGLELLDRRPRGPRGSAARREQHHVRRHAVPQRPLRLRPHARRLSPEVEVPPRRGPERRRHRLLRRDQPRRVLRGGQDRLQPARWPHGRDRRDDGQGAVERENRRRFAGRDHPHGALGREEPGPRGSLGRRVRDPRLAEGPRPGDRPARLDRVHHRPRQRSAGPGGGVQTVLRRGGRPGGEEGAAGGVGERRAGGGGVVVLPAPAGA